MGFVLARDFIRLANETDEQKRSSIRVREICGKCAMKHLYDDEAELRAFIDGFTTPGLAVSKETVKTLLTANEEYSNGS